MSSPTAIATSPMATRDQLVGGRRSAGSWSGARLTASTIRGRRRDRSTAGAGSRADPSRGGALGGLR